MTQQYPAQAETQTMQPKKKSKKWLYIGVGAAVFIVIIVAAGSNGSKGTSDQAPAVVSSNQPTHAKQDSKPAAQSPVQEFKAYVAAHGTAQDKAAVSHVTKIQGADSQNNILDSADVYTDYSGDMMSGDAASGKLIASSFRDWQSSRNKESKNGLVTVYNASGSILSNGNY